MFWNVQKMPNILLQVNNLIFKKYRLTFLKRRQEIRLNAALPVMLILNIPRFLPSSLFHLTLVLAAVVITLVIVRHAGLLHLP